MKNSKGNSRDARPKAALKNVFIAVILIRISNAARFVRPAVIVNSDVFRALSNIYDVFFLAI